MIWDFHGPKTDLNCPKLDEHATLGFLVPLQNNRKRIFIKLTVYLK